jgi:hypothetical protein
VMKVLQPRRVQLIQQHIQLRCLEHEQLSCCDVRKDFQVWCRTMTFLSSDAF